MPAPPVYDRDYSFTDWETTHPGEPKPGTALDTEFDDVSNALTATQEALALLQRTDGALANDSVGPDQLQDDVFDGIVDGITADAEAAADAAAAQAALAATSATSANSASTAAATSASNAAGAHANAVAAADMAAAARDDAVSAQAAAAVSADAAADAANETAGSVAQAQLHEEMAEKWAEYLPGPVEAVDDGKFSAKWWAVRAEAFASSTTLDFGASGADIGEAFTTWDAIPGNDLPLGQVFAIWQGRLHVLTDKEHPEDPASWVQMEGVDGADGPPNVLTIGTVTTGTPSSATITGTSPAQVLNLQLQPGPPNSLAIGTVTTLPPGSSATATISGTPPSQTLDLGIPQGATGTGGAGAGGNPTASIGLTAINGVATTLIRSDGAPALSQAIAPTWTGQHIFGRGFSSTIASMPLILQSATPGIFFNRTGAAANGKYWGFEIQANTLLHGSIYDDAGATSLAGLWLEVQRSVGSVINVELHSTSTIKLLPDLNTGQVRIGIDVAATSPTAYLVVTRDNGGDNIEWGSKFLSGSTAGARSHIGTTMLDNRHFIAFHAEAASSASTNNFRTRGVKGNILRSDLLGGIEFGRAPTASADGQALTVDLYWTTAGVFNFTVAPQIGGVADFALLSAGNAFTSASNYITNAVAQFGLRETGVAVDQGNWLLRADQSQFSILTATDAAPTSSAAVALLIGRSGTVVSTMQTSATAFAFSTADAELRRTDNVSRLVLLGGSSNNLANGGRISIYGTSHATQPGDILIDAGTGGDIVLTGATITHNGATLQNGAAGSVRDFQWLSSGVSRWVQRANSAAETGSNAGSDFELIARDDAGASLGNVFSVTRATRVLNFTVAPTIGGVAVVTTATGDARYAQLAAANTFSAQNTFTAATFQTGAAGTTRDFSYQTAGVNRWILRANSTAEAGSNAGSDFQINARADDGTDLGAALVIARATRVTDFKVAPTVLGAALLTQTSADARYAQLGAANVFTASSQRIQPAAGAAALRLTPVSTSQAQILYDATTGFVIQDMAASVTRMIIDGATGQVTFANETVSSVRFRVGSSPVSLPGLSSCGGTSGNDVEFGHSNTAGYRSTLGHNTSNGNPFLAFCAEAGTTANTFRTRGFIGHVLRVAVGVSFDICRVPSSLADDQALVSDISISSTTGVVNFASAPQIAGVADFARLSVANAFTAQQTITPAVASYLKAVAPAGTNIAVYQEWYRTGGSTRRGYLGYGSNAVNTLTLANEETAANIDLSCGGTGAVNITGGWFSLRGRNALADFGDGYLRLNDSAANANGVLCTNTIRSLYLRADTALYDAGASKSFTWNAGAFTYGTAYIAGAVGGYHGLALNDGTLNPTFMSSGTAAGIYIPGDAKWLWYRASGTQAVSQYPSVEAPAFNATSSRAIKRETGKPSRAADILARLRPIFYRLLADESREQLGLIAEEVHELCPQLSDGKTVSYDRLALLLLADWQESRGIA